MATNRDKHKEPVIRAFVSLRRETYVGASALLVAGFLCPLVTHVISFNMENETKMVCKFCAEEVKPEATICKHCGKKIKPVAESTLKQKRKVNPILLILLVCAFGAMVVIDFLPENTTTADPCDISYLKANRFVKESLKSPSTAEFPSRSEHSVINLGNNTCEVSSYVDSQNGFGAEVRSNWTATVQSDGGSNWTLSTLVIDGEQIRP